jgi:hypothetical protein
MSYETDLEDAGSPELLILLANSLRLLSLHCVERAGARMLRGSITKAAALWIRQQYPF